MTCTFNLSFSSRVSGEEVTNGKVGFVESLREHSRVPHVLVGDLFIAFEAQVEEVEHLGDDGCSGLGEISVPNVIQCQWAIIAEEGVLTM